MELSAVTDMRHGACLDCSDGKVADENRSACVDPPSAIICPSWYDVTANGCVKKSNCVGTVPVANTWRLLIEWDDGTKTEEAIADVMRID